MENIYKNMDQELAQAILGSAYNDIDYDKLLAADPVKIRAEELALSLREEPLTIPKMLDVRNIEIPSSTQSTAIRLRIYRPKGKQNLAALLFFHGGSFIYGTPEQYDFIFFRLALDVDLLIVSVDYRLAPEHPFPAGLIDGYDTLLWLHAHADQIGGNKHNILIGGSSAGATLAIGITQMAKDKKEVPIRHQYLLYPPTSHLLQTASIHELANAPMQSKIAATWMWRYYLQDDIVSPPKYAVPLLATDFKNLPDATLIVCELDPLKDEGKLYAQKLKEAAVPVNLLEIKGAVHAFDFFPCSLTNQFYHQQVQLFKKILKN